MAILFTLNLAFETARAVPRYSGQFDCFVSFGPKGHAGVRITALLRNRLPMLVGQLKPLLTQESPPGVRSQRRLMIGRILTVARLDTRPPCR